MKNPRKTTTDLLLSLFFPDWRRNVILVELTLKFDVAVSLTVYVFQTTQPVFDWTVVLWQLRSRGPDEENIPRRSPIIPHIP